MENFKNVKIWLYYKWNRLVRLKIISYKFLLLFEAIRGLLGHHEQLLTWGLWAISVKSQPNLLLPYLDSVLSVDDFYLHLSKFGEDGMVRGLSLIRGNLCDCEYPWAILKTNLPVEILPLSM